MHGVATQEPCFLDQSRLLLPPKQCCLQLYMNMYMYMYMYMYFWPYIISIHLASLELVSPSSFGFNSTSEV